MSTVTTWRYEEDDDAVSDFDTGTRDSMFAGTGKKRERTDERGRRYVGQ